MGIRERIQKKLDNLADERALEYMEQWLDTLTAKDKEKFSEEEIRSAMKGESFPAKPSEEEEKTRVLRDGPAKAGKRKQ